MISGNSWKVHQIYLVLDRYNENRLKLDTRDARIGAVTKENLLEIIKNKRNTRRINVNTAVKQSLKIRHWKAAGDNREIITPIMIHQGNIQTREDLKSSYDKADYIIPQ